MFCNFDTYFREKWNLIKEIESWKTMANNAASVAAQNASEILEKLKIGLSKCEAGDGVPKYCI